MQRANTNVNCLGRLGKNLKRDYVLYLFLIPTILWYILFCYFPMAGIYSAFTNYNGVGNMFSAKFVGLKWFEKFFNSAYAKSTIINTLRISLYSLAVFPLPIIMAIMLNMVYNEKIKKVSQTIMYAPHFISSVVLVSMIQCFFQRSNGLVNNVIEMVGGERIDFLNIPQYFASMYVWSGVWQNVGWDAIVYIAALAGVSSDQIEAAKIDGANRLQVVWHVNIPHILPTVVTLLIMRTGSVLSVGFEKIFLMQTPLNLEASRVLSTYVYEMGIQKGRLDYATAVGLFNNLVNVAILLIVNTVSKKLSETSLF